MGKEETKNNNVDFDFTRKDGTEELLKKIAKDENEIKVKEASSIFTALMKDYCNNTDSGRVVKEKLTEEEYTRFFTGICFSFLASLYCSASKDEKELDKRTKEVDSSFQVAYKKVDG